MGKRSKAIKPSIALFIGVTFAYFIWLSWKKLTEFVGDSDIIWCVTGLILILAIVGGYFSLSKVADKFT
ncbi:MAG: hypothetical protein KAS32_18560 [Candidatus Peribacteraceae bacterium]|nr:hypothetical protein [Candidatus Peribacteraceae bacterium]